MSGIQEVERHIIEVALERGFISHKDLERAAKFRTKLIERGRQTRLLKVLLPYLKPENYRELEDVWKQTSQGSLVTLEAEVLQDPSKPQPWLDLIRLRLALSDSMGALRDMNGCTRNLPSPPAEVFLLRGEILASLGRVAEARADLEHLLTLAPGGARALRAHEILAQLDGV